MIATIIIFIIFWGFCLLLLGEYKKKNYCPCCGTKLDWQDRGKEKSPLGFEAVKQAGYCPLCQKDRQVRFFDDQYY